VFEESKLEIVDLRFAQIKVKKQLQQRKFTQLCIVELE
jgi:hypothetical protein